MLAKWRGLNATGMRAINEQVVGVNIDMRGVVGSGSFCYTTDRMYSLDINCPTCSTSR